jgi:pimeloyl-ACP methyl ester carboxylesterase
VTGARPRWLLLRGLGREQRHWGAFPDLLGAAVGAPVACVDLPGFGTEHQRRSPASVAAITLDVRRRFATLRGDGPWCVLGISLGAMIALDWCARFPSDFERCVAVNTSSRRSPRRDRFRAPPGDLARALFGPRLERERAVLRVSSNRGAADLEPVARQYASWQRERPPALGSVATQLIAASAFDLPARWTTPLLVLASSADHLVSCRCSQTIAEALGATLRLHDAAGHDLALDAPEWMRDEILRWTGAPAARPHATPTTNDQEQDR